MRKIKKTTIIIPFTIVAIFILWLVTPGENCSTTIGMHKTQKGEPKQLSSLDEVKAWETIKPTKLKKNFVIQVKYEVSDGVLFGRIYDVTGLDFNNRYSEISPKELTQIDGREYSGAGVEIWEVDGLQQGNEYILVFASDDDCLYNVKYESRWKEPRWSIYKGRMEDYIASFK